MSKLNRQHISEFDRYFTPKPAIVTTLPNVKDVRDFTEVFIKNTDGTYASHKMIAGKWIKTGDGIKTTSPSGVVIPPGGSAGQVLAKVSDNSYDMVWTTAIETVGGLFESDANGDEQPVDSINAADFELDANNDLEPSPTIPITSIDPYYELDANNDITPKAA